MTAGNFPEILDCVERCRATLPLKHPVDVIVMENPRMNAFAVGFGSSSAIVLTSNLVESLDKDEITYVIAHEWGHLFLRHTLYTLLARPLIQVLLMVRGEATGSAAVSPRKRSTSASGQARPQQDDSASKDSKADQSEKADAARDAFGVAIVVVALLLLPVLFLAYRRFAEISADRVGVTIVGNAEKPMIGLAKIAVGPHLARQLTQGQVIAEADKLSGSLFGAIAQWLGDHPFIGTRMKEMHRWVNSPEYSQLQSILRTGPSAGLPSSQVIKTL